MPHGPLVICGTHNTPRGLHFSRLCRRFSSYYIHIGIFSYIFIPLEDEHGQMNACSWARSLVIAALKTSATSPSCSVFLCFTITTTITRACSSGRAATWFERSPTTGTLWTSTGERRLRMTLHRTSKNCTSLGNQLPTVPAVTRCISVRCTHRKEQR